MMLTLLSAFCDPPKNTLLEKWLLVRFVTFLLPSGGKDLKEVRRSGNKNLLRSPRNASWNWESVTSLLVKLNILLRGSKISGLQKYVIHCSIERPALANLLNSFQDSRVQTYSKREQSKKIILLFCGWSIRVLFLHVAGPIPPHPAANHEGGVCAKFLFYGEQPTPPKHHVGRNSTWNQRLPDLAHSGATNSAIDLTTFDALVNEPRQCHDDLVSCQQ